MKTIEFRLSIDAAIFQAAVAAAIGQAMAAGAPRAESPPAAAHLFFRDDDTVGAYPTLSDAIEDLPAMTARRVLRAQWLPPAFVVREPVFEAEDSRTGDILHSFASAAEAEAFIAEARSAAR